ncbi:MAG TPA: NAD(P)/FAD-dependent oxidoreductase [Lachnospiraceae bacterium]|nr:NAD(P)/FAD-dependent oxidoreductase [Lachnospiraceae bacterium]
MVKQQQVKSIVIIGAGPAGLTAAYEIKKKQPECTVTVLEESDCIGGISRTVEYKGNRMDMGGHRFFSKSERVNEWWQEILPMQGAPSKDDRILERNVTLTADGPDPEQEDRTMLYRTRISRIFFEKKFFDYPISLKWETFRNMGFLTTMKVGFSYLASIFHKKKEDSLENFYINRFGKKLYSMFFENYTQNLWGRHPSEISAEWGAQRVKGLSIIAIIKDVFGRIFHKKNRKVETSLIETFKYPKHGPGQIWEQTASLVEEMGGCVKKNCKVVRLITEGNRVTAVVYEQDGKEETMEADAVISSMPIKDLIAGIEAAPDKVAQIAADLPYRDYMTVGLLLSGIKLKNTTKFKTLGNIVPDCWIYVHDKKLKLGRVQIYNNWSPYMVQDPEHTILVGLEYFCNEGDQLWSMTDEAFAKLAIQEFIQMGCIDDAAEVLDSHVERVKKAYPAYFDSYDRIDEVISYLNTFDNLYCVGRNGQHRYNNMDHSMETAFEAVDCILEHKTDKTAIWNVNTEQEYHEENK